jgi:hypothetical protein
VQFFRAEVEGRLIAVVRLTDDGQAFRLSRNRPTWERVPELDRLTRALPGDLIYWDAVDEATAQSAAAQLVSTASR